VQVAQPKVTVDGEAPEQGIQVSGSWFQRCTLSLIVPFVSTATGAGQMQLESFRIMGLDNFWRLPEGKQPPVFMPSLRLSGGLLTEHGERSFRGSRYNDVVVAVTGVSLYNEATLHEEVCRMSEKLDQHPWDSEWNVTHEEYGDLQRMFRGYAEAGADLLGWW
jgi:hypothetical protein